MQQIVVPLSSAAKCFANQAILNSVLRFFDSYSQAGRVLGQLPASKCGETAPSLPNIVRFFAVSDDQAKPDNTPQIEVVPIDTFIDDDDNANQGTDKGNVMLGQSLALYGAGRSALVDKNGRLISGNKTRSKAQAAGINEAIVVRTRGEGQGP